MINFVNFSLDLENLLCLQLDEDQILLEDEQRHKNFFNKLINLFMDKEIL